MQNITINLKDVYGEVAKLHHLETYLNKILELAGEGNEVTLTGAAPVWLYLHAAHALHGKVRKLFYDSPATGKLLIYDHDPF